MVNPLNLKMQRSPGPMPQGMENPNQRPWSSMVRRSPPRGRLAQMRSGQMMRLETVITEDHRRRRKPRAWVSRKQLLPLVREGD